LGNIHKKVLRSMRFYKTLAHFGCNDAYLASQMGDMYLDISPKKTALLPNAIEVLDYLAGKYVMHIITNGFEEVQHTKLECAGLAPYFDLIMTSELASARKPDPIIFQLAMLKTGATAPDSLMIGDDLIADIGGARSLWMDQVFYNPEGLAHSEEVTHEITDLIELKTLL
jgi:putative hydrolase of the HAD superfamily